MNNYLLEPNVHNLSGVNGKMLKRSQLFAESVKVIFLRVIGVYSIAKFSGVVTDRYPYAIDTNIKVVYPHAGRLNVREQAHSNASTAEEGFPIL
jgi:hypothetical protein